MDSESDSAIFVHASLYLNLHVHNESTVGADASVKSLKLYDMKQLTLAYLALLGTRYI